MTVNNLGYNIPSTHQMIKSINNHSPIMLKVHSDEFNRINRKFDRKETLSTPYTDYLKMLYVEYIANKKESIQPNIIVQPVHIGMRLLNTLT